MKQMGKNIVFHFNKAHLADPSIPMWTLKIEGQTFYCKHIEFENCSFSSKETPDNPHTKGSIKFKNTNCEISDDGTARLWQEKVV